MLAVETLRPKATARLQGAGSRRERTGLASCGAGRPIPPLGPSPGIRDQREREKRTIKMKRKVLTERLSLNVTADLVARLRAAADARETNVAELARGAI